MSRNSAGTYSLPSGNPVSPNTLIDAVWANTTLTDLAVAMTDSLSRTAQGGMQAPLRLVDGTAGTPALAFTNETSSGLYRIGSQQLAIAVAGIARLTLTSTGVDVTGNLSATGTFTATGALTAASFIPSGSAVPANGLYLPAANTIGLATNTTLRASINSTGNVVVAAPTSGVAISVTGVSGQNVLATTDGTASFAVKLGGVSGVELTTSSNHQMFLSTNNTVRVTIAAAGNITIAAPSSGPSLTVNAIALGVMQEWADGTRLARLTQDASTVIFGASSNHAVALMTNGTVRQTITNSGNFGLNYSAPNTWSSAYTGLQIGGRGSGIWGRSDANQLGFAENCYFDNTSATFKYINTGSASIMNMLSGAITFSTVPSGTAGTNVTTINDRLIISLAGLVTIGPPNSGQNALSVVGVSGAVPFKVTATGASLAEFTISENTTRFVTATNSNTSGNIGFETVVNGVSARLLSVGSNTTAATGTGTNHQFGIEQNSIIRQAFAVTSGKSSFVVGAYTAGTTVTFSATPTFDANTTNYFELSTALTANITSMTISNGSIGQTVTIRMIQDGTGGRTVAVPSGAKVAGAVGATAGAVSLLTLTWSGSLRWEGSWLNLPA